MLKSIFWYFGSRTVLSVCFPETLSLYINHQSNVWTMTKESYNLYVYFIIAIFSNQFYPYLKLRWPGTVGEKYPPKRKKSILPTLNYSKLHWRSEIIPDTLNCANHILDGASAPKSVFDHPAEPFRDLNL